jgi:hypothetical protein
MGTLYRDCVMLRLRRPAAERLLACAAAAVGAIGIVSALTQLKQLGLTAPYRWQRGAGDGRRRSQVTTCLSALIERTGGLRRGRTEVARGQVARKCVVAAAPARRQ